MIPLTRTGTHGLAIAIVGVALFGAGVTRPVAIQAADPESTTAASQPARENTNVIAGKRPSRSSVLMTSGLPGGR